MSKKKEIIHNELTLTKELHDSIKSLLDEIHSMGWELNDDGDIVEKESGRLVWEIYNESKEEQDNRNSGANRNR